MGLGMLESALSRLFIFSTAIAEKKENPENQDAAHDGFCRYIALMAAMVCVGTKKLWQMAQPTAGMMEERFCDWKRHEVLRKS